MASQHMNKLSSSSAQLLALAVVATSVFQNSFKSRQNPDYLFDCLDFSFQK